SGVVEPVQGPEQAMAAGLRRLDERLHGPGLREPESAMQDQLGRQVSQLVEPRGGDAEGSLGPRSLSRGGRVRGGAGRPLLLLVGPPDGSRVVYSLPSEAGAAAKHGDPLLEVIDKPMQRVVQYRRGTLTHLLQLFLELMDHRGQFLQT